MKKILLLIWFLVSLAGVFLVKYTSHPEAWFITIFGQYFVVFSLLFLFAPRENKGPIRIELITLLVGVGCLTIGIYMLISGEEAINIIEDLAPLFGLGLFVVVGLFFIYYSFSKTRHLKSVCTQIVTARCVYVREKNFHNPIHGGYTKKYMPLYSFHLNGEDLELYCKKYSSKKVEAGEYRELRVNPNNPKEFIDSNRISIDGPMLLLGLMFVIFPGAVLIELLIRR